MGGPIGLAAGDWDGDGGVDLVSGNYDGDSLTVLWANRGEWLVEDPVGSGVRTGAGRGNLSGSGDVDYWSFSGRAGDRLVVAVETLGHVGGSGLYYRVERPDGVELVRFYAGANGTGQSAPVVLPVSGRYGVQVSSYYSYWGEYRLRVSLASAPWQLEAEDNNTVSQANQPSFTWEAGVQRAQLLGYIRHGDPADVFHLGNLSVGTEARMSYGRPTSSGLVGALSILNSSGPVVASVRAGLTNLSFTVPAGQAGAYYARIQAGTAGYSAVKEWALLFDGVDDYVDIGAWSPGSNWTVEAWVRPMSLAAGRRTIVGGVQECRDWGITLQDGRFGVVIRQPGGCSQTILAPETATVGAWYHVVGTCDGQTARLYVNGQLRAFGPVESNYVGTTAGTRIGGEVCCSGNSFAGFVDEVAIWNRSLTGPEIQARLAGPLAGDESGLVGYWRFNEGQGGTTADASRAGRHGTLVNGVTWVSLAPASASEPGLMSQYLLTLELADASPPTIVADTLPLEGAQVLDLVDRFTLTFSEDTLATTVNNPTNYEMRSAGPDGLFDTPDDMVWPITVSPAYSSGLTASFRLAAGALQPGQYRFTATSALQDRAGNRLAAPFQRSFVVIQLNGFATETEPNNTRSNATALPLTNSQPGLISGAGRGFLADQNDVDFWGFEARAGDVLVVASEVPGNPSGSRLYFEIYNPSGTRLASHYAEPNGLLQTAPRVLPETGLYTIRISYNWSYYGEHRIRVSLYRGGLPVEVEPNNTVATATPLVFTNHGVHRTAVVAGYVQTATDFDYFNLGVIEAGKTVFISTREPTGSPLVPVVSLYNAANVYLPEAGGGRPSDGVAEVRIEQTGTYYALLRAGAGSAGLMSEYLLDVLVLPTADVVFPNLQVLDLVVPVTTGLRSGDIFSFRYSVTNVGSLPTPVNRWFDRVVLSSDPAVSADDIELGLYPHDGGLSPGQGYAVTQTVRLPDGLSGSFYVVVKVDATDTVNEFLLEGDNELATDNPFSIGLASYPDLRIENLALVGPDTNQMYRVRWDTFNRGTAPAAAGFKDRLRVRNQTTAITIFDQSWTVAPELGPNNSISREVSFNVTNAGSYVVEVTTDSDRVVYEHDGVSHLRAESNTVTTNFAVTRSVTLTLQSAPPGAGILTGSGIYPEGTVVTAVAIPVTSRAPYYFVHWAEEGLIRSTSSNYTFVLREDTTLTAVFGLPTYQISVTNNPAGAGTVGGTGSYVWGTTNTLTAQPTFGYKFSYWSEHGEIIGTNPVLTVVVYSNRYLVAHYAEAHLFHVVSTATSPEGLATVAGAGVYTNGQTGTIRAPLTITNAPPDYYIFRRFLLNGALFGTNSTFQKTFATTDPTNMHFVAVYELVDATPPRIGPITVQPSVASASLSWTNSEPVSAMVVYGTNALYGFTNMVAQLRSQHAFVLLGLVPATTYHFRVMVTDAAGNRTVSENATFTTLSPPDLAAGEIRVPESASAGTVIPVIFTFTNLGPGTVRDPWQNQVLISPNADGSGAASLGSIRFDPGPAGLAPGATVTVTQQVIVPAIGTGPRWLGIRLDSGDVIVETNETNNTAFARIPLHIVATDLFVTRVDAPSAARFGETIRITYVVTNAGAAGALASWNDRIDLSTVSDAPGTLLVTAPAGRVPLPAGAAYTNWAEVRLPLSGVATSGVYYLVVWTDSENVVPEASDGNNLRSVSVVMTLPPLPDLVVTNVIAPTNAQPGERVPVVYTVVNEGSTDAGPLWWETVYLGTNASGAGVVELAASAYTNLLVAGATLVRTQWVTIPATGLVGSWWFTVWADSRDDIIESIETNNLGVASVATVVPAKLTLQLSSTQISEGASQPILATVLRNGSRSGPLPVVIQNGDPSEISVTNQIVIPAGASSAQFQVVALLDGVADGPQTVTLGVAASGYEPAQAQLTVLDIDRPRLYLSFGTNRVWEGGALQGTLSRDAGTESLTVSLVSSSPGQLLVPSTVTLPAGQSSAGFVVTGVDDTALEPPMSVAISASAPGYFGSTADISMLDDDWPLVMFEATPPSVSESAGPQAVRVRVDRLPLSPRALELELESSHPELVAVPARLTIPGGETNAAFWLAVHDNDTVEDEREVTVRHWVLATGTRTRLAEGVPLTVRITDDDGPALKLQLDRVLVPEGQTNAARLTIRRNASVQAPLAVALTSSHTNEARVPAQVFIPAGAVSVTVPVETVQDGITDGNQVVTFTATAIGFIAGTITLVVSDIHLPDLIVSEVVAPAAAETDSYVDVTYTLRNQGDVAVPSNAVVQRVYLSSDAVAGDDILVAQYTFHGALPAGGHYTQILPVRVPQTPGAYWLIVVADAQNGVVEVLEDNNLTFSSTPLRVSPAYSAVVSTSLEVAPAGTAVPMSGEARRPGGQPAAHVVVGIHIKVRDTIRTIAALTDSMGRFHLTWQPLPGEADFYEIAAGHPGAPMPPRTGPLFIARIEGDADAARGSLERTQQRRRRGNLRESRRDSHERINRCSGPSSAQYPG
ncbi:MAG: CARDB domain-containing protein [Verrucomicrobiota bacterium]|nr:Ig-like domain-containing protein [Limisphaera sp.]MDW8380511.1 CARDB domain-containing protein [Verrucomicrobiota bacterium]